jgi:AraC-like DNA-binding protein
MGPQVRVEQRLISHLYALLPMVTVCAILPPPERARLDAAGHGCFTALHVDSLHDVRSAARRQRVDALVISVHRCDGLELPAVARFVHEFPAIPAVALVSRHDSDATETLLRLGATGVRAAVDCTQPSGWRRLRELVGHPASPAATRILARVLPTLGNASDDARLFIEVLARSAPVLTTVRGLARHLRVGSSTLMSRFYRAGLPSPKSYLAGARLLHAAYLFQNPGLSVADVAYRLDYSSPQSFGRHLKAMLGVTAGEFRRRFPFEVALTRFVDLLITPYREALRAFHPVNAGTWDQGPDAARASRAG